MCFGAKIYKTECPGRTPQTGTLDLCREEALQIIEKEQLKSCILSYSVKLSEYER